jgi:hypothetical protein
MCEIQAMVCWSISATRERMRTMPSGQCSGLGARSLNIELQNALNPPGEVRIDRFGWTFCLLKG